MTGRRNSNMTIDQKEITAIDEYYNLKQKLALTLKERALYARIFNERRHKKIPSICFNAQWDVL